MKNNTFRITAAALILTVSTLLASCAPAHTPLPPSVTSSTTGCMPTATPEQCKP